MTNKDPVEKAVVKKAARRKAPLALRMIRLAFRALGPLAPSLAARWAYRLWFQTRRYGEPARETRWLKQAEQFRLAHDGGELAVYAWGQGPTVLLLHGWNGRGPQMGAFVQPLVRKGYRIVAFDMPGHGRSTGNSTNIFVMVKALRAVAETAGPLAAIIAHSFGVVCTAMALEQGLTVDRVVCMSSPLRLRWMFDRFSAALTLPNKVKARFERMLELEFGSDIWQRIAADKIAARLTTPALVIHDEQDYDVPWQHGETLARVWTGARFLRTRGLGHRRILRNRKIIDSSVDFIAEAAFPITKNGTQ